MSTEIENSKDLSKNEYRFISLKKVMTTMDGTNSTKEEGVWGQGR